MLGDDEQRMEDIFIIMCVCAFIYVIYKSGYRYTCEVERGKLCFLGKRLSSKVWLSESHEFCFFYFFFGSFKEEEGDEERRRISNRERRERDEKRLRSSKKQKKERETEEKCFCVRVCVCIISVDFGHQTSSRIMHLTNRIK